MTDCRRSVFRATRGAAHWIDPYLRSVPMSDRKSDAWFADQYLHPHESTHTFAEVIDWFAKTGVAFVRGVPSTAGADGDDPDGTLFDPTDPGPRGITFACSSADRERQSGRRVLRHDRPKSGALGSGMALFQPNRNPTARDLRWFAGLWFPLFCGGAGLWLLRHRRPGLAAAWWTATAVLAVAGLISPPAIRPIYRFLIRVTFPIGWVVSHTVVAAAYFLVITPIGLVMRLRHDPMRRRFEPSARWSLDRLQAGRTRSLLQADVRIP